MPKLPILAFCALASVLVPEKVPGQEASTVATLDSLLRDTLITDGVVLHKITRNNVAFIPTRDRIDSLVTQRPWLRDTLTRVLAGACVRGNPKIAATVSEVVFLLTRASTSCSDEASLVEYLGACPQGGTYGGLRSVAQAHASRRLLSFLAELCHVRIDRPKWELAAQLKRSVLTAADAMHSAEMGFGDGAGASLKISYAAQRSYRVALALETGRHNLDASGIDLQPAGRFNLWSLTGSTRLVLSCLWNRDRCGDPLLSKGDAYVETSVGIDHLGGDMRLTASPSYLASVGINTTGPFGFSFRGWGVGLSAGYRWRLTRVFALEAESRYAAIRFDHVTVRAPDFSPMKGDVTGWSTRLSFGFSVAALVRP